MISHKEDSAVAIQLADIKVADAADAIIAYLEGRHNQTSKRILDYDYDSYLRRQSFLDGSSSWRITEGSIASAIKLKGRLAYSQLVDWYRPREKTCNWENIQIGETFVTCNPSKCGGSYDDLSSVWFNFSPLYVLKRKAYGVGSTQINKVLHQVIPEVVPIFDEKFRKLYFVGKFRGEAKKICGEVALARNVEGCGNGYQDGFLWEPFRRDMEKISQEDFELIRGQISTRPCGNKLTIDGLPAQIWASKYLSDVRLIDMIAWQL